MSKIDNLLLDFNDILIKPAIISDINSRGEINPYYKNGMLPLFTAPMDTVVNSGNYDIFLKNRINVCLPRGESSNNKDVFVSYSLMDFKKYFLNKKYVVGSKCKVLIDTANGHLKDMVDSIRLSKEMHGDNLILMVGNIANPRTYFDLSVAGADYVRVGIGNGGGCLTTQQTGVGFPMASLIRECYNLSFALENPAKIVADGGMKTYSDIIKALALGADYVMVGSILNKCLESAGSNYLFNLIPVNQEIAENLFSHGIKVHKKFRGMSTKEVQKKWGNKFLKTSEGVVRFRKVEYTLNGWVNNFESYLRSAMSYSDSIDLEKFTNYCEIIQITDNAYKRFNK